MTEAPGRLRGGRRSSLPGLLGSAGDRGLEGIEQNPFMQRRDSMTPGGERDYVLPRRPSGRMLVSPSPRSERRPSTSRSRSPRSPRSPTSPRLMSPFEAPGMMDDESKICSPFPEGACSRAMCTACAATRISTSSRTKDLSCASFRWDWLSPPADEPERKLTWCMPRATESGDPLHGNSIFVQSCQRCGAAPFPPTRSALLVPTLSGSSPRVADAADAGAGGFEPSRRPSSLCSQGRQCASSLVRFLPRLAASAAQATRALALRARALARSQRHSYHVTLMPRDIIHPCHVPPCQKRCALIPASSTALTLTTPSSTPNLHQH
eukprot:924170-Rhodomonas_salina.1